MLVVPQPYGGDFTVYSATQIPHILRVMLALTVGVPETKLRVVAPAVGGGFGSKLNVYAEEVLTLALARQLRQPVRWVRGADRALPGDHPGPGPDPAHRSGGRRRRADHRGPGPPLADMGAYLQLVTPGIPLLGAFLYAGVYDVPAYSFTCTSVFTNKTPTDAYRGAGRPEATYAIERAMDALARQVGVDPAEIRRRNFIPPDQFPYNSVGRAGLRQRQLRAGPGPGPGAGRLRRAAGRAGPAGGRRVTPRQLGHRPVVVRRDVRPGARAGCWRRCNYVAGGWEAATVRILPTAKVQVVTGTSPHGQGHETSWSMIVADRLGISPDDIEVLHSDTAIAPYGLDTYGSRSLAVGGTAVYLATDRVIDKARRIAAHQLEAAEEDLEFAGGQFAVRGSPDRAMPLGGGRLRGVHRPQPARRHGAQPGGVEPLRPAQLHLPVRDPHRPWWRWTRRPAA